MTTSHADVVKSKVGMKDMNKASPQLYTNEVSLDAYRSMCCPLLAGAPREVGFLPVVEG
ncbi:hypothetical protein [Pseudomonas syringae]|uniref:hypothetical protein n=1 Tax=Pseudomonas syringae TaxID=317 RepID=UPI0012AEDB99|nr:hypothetical protein [Pseudomonas syringae]